MQVLQFSNIAELNFLSSALAVSPDMMAWPDASMGLKSVLLCAAAPLGHIRHHHPLQILWEHLY